MKITFLGTRGYLDVKNRRHRRHSSALLRYKNSRIMMDCGLDWKKKVWEIRPTAIFITHGHPDHAWGLQEGSPCPVYATEESWEIMKDYDIKERRQVRPGGSMEVGGFCFQAFPVVHSLRAPAVGYRISAGKHHIWYLSDVVAIPQQEKALKNLSLYIGDGSTLTRPLVRRQGNKLFGHTTIRAQLGWCGQQGVERAIFTHCGTEIVEGDERKLKAKLKALGRERGVEADFAYDGMQVKI